MPQSGGGAQLAVLLGTPCHKSGRLVGVAGGLVLALLLLDGLALNNVVLDVVLLLLGPALGLVLGPAHLDGLVVDNLLVVNEAVLPEVLLALLLLLGLVVGHVGGVAPHAGCNTHQSHHASRRRVSLVVVITSAITRAYTGSYSR